LASQLSFEELELPPRLQHIDACGFVVEALPTTRAALQGTISGPYELPAGSQQVLAWVFALSERSFESFASIDIIICERERKNK
jgi:hypothetical protein